MIIYLLSCYLLPGWKVEPSDVEEVPDHPSLDVDVELRVGVQAGGDIHLQDPRLQLPIQHDVKTKQLMNTVSIA